MPQSAEHNLSELARRAYRAYETKDRREIEALLAEDFTFTSPHDDHIDRKTYFERCWPNSENTRAFTFERLFEQGNEVFVHYKLELKTGAIFRNVELLRFEENKIVEVDVYFGRTLKEAPEK